LLWDCDAGVVDRCNKYLPQITRESRYALGLSAPYPYFAGQIEQESKCDEGVTAFDGGQGLGQFMPATAKDLQERETALKELGLNPQPFNPKWAIRALILYDKYLYTRTTCTGWYFVFRAYNGGAGGLNREIALAKSCDQDYIEKYCKRKVLTLKGGTKLDLCKVNCDYPDLIMSRAKKYDRNKILP
jgi:hypothetical protein